MAVLEAALIALGPLEARNLFFREHAFDRVKYTVEGIDLPVGLEGDAGRAGRVLGLLWFHATQSQVCGILQGMRAKSCTLQISTSGLSGNRFR
jgi:hypothetical protein